MWHTFRTFLDAVSSLAISIVVSDSNDYMRLPTKLKKSHLGHDSQSVQLLAVVYTVIGIRDF